jgi:hypothetical protein
MRGRFNTRSWPAQMSQAIPKDRRRRDASATCAIGAGKSDNDGIAATSLLQGVHQASNYAIEIFVGTTQFFYFIDGVEHGRVMFTAELTADLR